MTYITIDFFLLFFALKNVLVLLAKPDSGELRCPATALIFFGLTQWFTEIIVCDKWQLLHMISYVLMFPKNVKFAIDNISQK